MDIVGYEYWILGYCSGGVAPWMLFFGMLGFLYRIMGLYDGNPFVWGIRE